jgi:hypothetical protein
VKDVFAKLAADFLSAAVFFILYVATDEVVLATAAAIAVAVVQVVYARIKGHSLSFMAYASVGLVIVLGGVTLLTISPSASSCSSAVGCCVTFRRSCPRPSRNTSRWRAMPGRP